MYLGLEERSGGPSTAATSSSTAAVLHGAASVNVVPDRTLLTNRIASALKAYFRRYELLSRLVLGPGVQTRSMATRCA